MSHLPRRLRRVVLVALCLAGLGPVVNAGNRPPEARAELRASGEAHFARFRHVLALLWSKYGPMVDPDGAPASGTTAQGTSGCQGEYGPMVDPSGQCNAGQ